MSENKYAELAKAFRRGLLAPPPPQGIGVCGPDFDPRIVLAALDLMANLEARIEAAAEMAIQEVAAQSVRFGREAKATGPMKMNISVAPVCAALRAALLPSETEASK